jgi:hypothetical protein
MAYQEMPGQRQTGRHPLAARSRRRIDQECRQGKQPILPRCARGGRNGTSGPRRDMNQVVRRPGNGAAAEIQSEAELRQQSQLPADIGGRPAGVGFDRRDQPRQ